MDFNIGQQTLAPTALPPGRSLGRYVLEQVFGNRYSTIEQVGSGGMATVYRGKDSLLKRDVAIKVLHPHLAGRDDARRRFNREAQAIARLHHSNIVDVYDFSGDRDQHAYLITEFVYGQTLTSFCKAHGPFLPQSVALIGHAIAGALSHAHTEGIIHRDIKPDNLMISTSGTIKLMDFGIATAMDLEQMTATGAILGSPAHMAPEQIDGQDIDLRVDVFAFGTVLYYLSTGRLPFMATNPHALFRQILECRYEPASQYNMAMGRRFGEIISTCMARDPTDRFSSMAMIQDALGAYLRDHKMSDDPKLLRRLLTAPEQFQLEWRPVLVQVLCEEGRKQAKTGSLALAIDAYNRAMSIDPKATEPKRGLNDLTSRSRRIKRLRALAATIAITVVGAGALYALKESSRTTAEPAKATPAKVAKTAPTAPPENQPTAVAQAANNERLVATRDTQPRMIPGQDGSPEGPMIEPLKAEKAKASERSGDDGRTEANRLQRRKKNRRAARANKPAEATPSAGPKQEQAPIPKDGLIEYTLASSPPAASLYLDGKLISHNGHARRQLKTGSSHELRCVPTEAMCPGCKPVVQRFVVPQEPPARGSPAVKCNFSSQRKRLGLSNLPRSR